MALWLGGTPATAKLEFTTEVSDGPSSSDRTIAVTVRTPEPHYTSPGSQLSMAEALGRSIEVFAVADLDDSWRPLPGADGVTVEVEQTEPGVFLGQVELPALGQWAVVPFPDSERFHRSCASYQTVAFEIPWSDPAHRVITCERGGGASLVVLAAINGGAAALLAPLGWLLWRDRRRTRSGAGSTEIRT